MRADPGEPGVRPLLPGDPSQVGDNRLLGRLGAGGMGVVYLARSADGALVAVKVVRAEHAADPDFLVRFRREAEAAGRLEGRFLVPVTAADPGAEPPWLATAFVPGLSLAEAVEGHGPLPVKTVRVLGTRLSEALAEVHAAGLVHRDVKPGNVLLTPDGPRLIDFGIARADGMTALTASDLVIGSPGYLAPEQARARHDEVGPPGDVFSLGCLLAFAATGHPPFGHGTVAGVLFRTVHEEPDLEDVPDSLLPLLRGCLAKDPQRRPTTAEVRDALVADPRELLLQPSGGSGRPDGTDGGASWLPAPLPGIIAERAARILALPDPEPRAETAEAAPGAGLAGTPVAAPGPTAAPAPSGPRRPSRRSLLAFGAAALAAGGGTLAWNMLGAGGVARPRCTIGVQADLSGEQAALGQAQVRGAKLAVARLNADGNRAFDLELAVRDDRGEAESAVRVAERFIRDPEVCAVLGPTGEAGIGALVARHRKALLPLVTVSCATSAMNIGSGRDRSPVFQLRPEKNGLAVGFYDYLTKAGRSERTALVDDRATAGEEGWDLLERLKQSPPAGGSTTTHTVPAGSDDFGPVAARIRSAHAQAVIYVGNSPQRAARCARALDRAGFDGVRMAPEPVLRPELSADGRSARLPFTEEAGDAADGWVCVTSYADARRLPGTADFAASYAERFPSAPPLGPASPFAAEAYDALRLVTAALRPRGDRPPERGATTRRLRSVHHEGLVKPLEFDAVSGGFEPYRSIFFHRIEDGAAVFLGRTEDVK